MTRRFTDESVAKLKAKAKRYTVADPELPGHYVRVQPNGSKSLVVVVRDPNGKQHWRTIGALPMTIDTSRDLGRKAIRAIREAPPSSFEGVASAWFKRYVVKRKQRATGNYLRLHYRALQTSLGDAGKLEPDALSLRVADTVVSGARLRPLVFWMIPIPAMGLAI
jgi:hypothetical protein